MRTLLTGASGSLGKYLLENWGDDQRFVFTGRTSVHHQRYFNGSVLDSEFLDNIVDQHSISTIVHNAANTAIWGPWSEFENSNIAMMKSVIDVAKRKHLKIIFLSTPSIYHYSNKQEVTEDFEPVKFPNFYAQSKYFAEQMLRESDVPYIIFRPRAVVGKTDQTLLPKLMNQYAKGRLSIIGKGDNVADFTAMRNIQHALELSLNADVSAWNQVYNLTNGSPTNVYELINYLLSGLGYQPIEKRVPVTLARTYGFIMEMQGKLLDKEPSITRYQMELLYLNYTLSIQKAIKLLGYSPIQSNKEMIDELIQANNSLQR